ncbi:MAG: hypothetical protein CMJ20_06875 [Phycisphaeraceae bacterium]|nr:hypothetical protein [Phycisphaeraceae bacterium]|tara:strand:+ start:644 stop:853 length:210 start_codon:yes stop_codon:yes gene_type:complete
MSYKVTEEQAQQAIVQCFVAMRRLQTEQAITEAMMSPYKKKEWEDKHEFYEKQLAQLKIKFPQFWKKEK